MLMPLAMPATLRMIDMRPVYDGLQQEITMRSRVSTSVLLAMLGMGAAAAGAPAQNQT
jgi:hypothetical protein